LLSPNSALVSSELVDLFDVRGDIVRFYRQ
jgi:hypothetical protein